MDEYQSLKNKLDIAINKYNKFSSDMDFDYICDIKIKLNSYLDHILHTIKEYINELEQYHLQIKYKKTKKTNRMKNEIKDKKHLNKIVQSIKNQGD